MKVVKIRFADLEDMNDIFEWRNEVDSVINSLSKEKVCYKKHQDWYLSRLKQLHKNPILIAESNSDPINKFGMVRFDIIKENIFRVSININPSFRGKGLAKEILINAENFFFKEINILVAEVWRNNEASKKVFTNSGYLDASSETSDPIMYLKQTFNET